MATDERKHTSPPASVANVKFGTTSPARKLTVDASGTLPPQVYTVTKPSATGVTTVKFSAAMRRAGRDPRSAGNLDPPFGVGGQPAATAVSSKRLGVAPWKSPAAVNQPIKSAIRCTDAEELKHSPLAGNLSATMLATA